MNADDARDERRELDALQREHDDEVRQDREADAYVDPATVWTSITAFRSAGWHRVR